MLYRAFDRSRETVIPPPPRFSQRAKKRLPPKSVNAPNLPLLLLLSAELWTTKHHPKPRLRNLPSSYLFHSMKVTEVRLELDWTFDERHAELSSREAELSSREIAISRQRTVRLHSLWPCLAYRMLSTMDASVEGCARFMFFSGWLDSWFIWQSTWLNCDLTQVKTLVFLLDATLTRLKSKFYISWQVRFNSFESVESNLTNDSHFNFNFIYIYLSKYLIILINLIKSCWRGGGGGVRLNVAVGFFLLPSL